MISIEKFNDVLEHENVSLKMKKGFILPYYFETASSAEFPFSSRPLVISMHAMRSNVLVPKARYADWNFLRPFDCYGYKDEGSFWAVGYPDFPLLDAIIDLVESYRDKQLFNREVYISGSSSSGIACVYLANKLKATAVYLNVPVLSSDTLSAVSTGILERSSSVFGESGATTKASEYLYKGMKTRFHIVDQRFGFKDFAVLNSYEFVGKCLELGINVNYELLPTSGHSVTHTMHYVLKLFSKYPNDGTVLSTGFPTLVEEEGILIDEVDCCS